MTDDDQEFMRLKVTGAPDEIWLNYGDIERDCTHTECVRDGEVTWCEDSAFESDVKYVRADRLEAAEKDAARDVLAERQRQISDEDWTLEHDNEHGDGSLADAAACYALTDPIHYGGESREFIRDVGRSVGEAIYVKGRAIVPLMWPKSWNPCWFKPKDRRRDLVRAAALILAEIERIDRRAAMTKGPT
jgi:hypothetical protein